MRKFIVILVGIALIVSLASCAQTVPVYNPPVTVIQTTVITDVVTTTPATTTTTADAPVVVDLPTANYARPDNPGIDGIGKPLKQITLDTSKLGSEDLVAVCDSPIWNSGDTDATFSLTYGIFEQRDDMAQAPAYFQDFISTYSLVDVPGESWVDVPVVFTIPKGTVGLPTGTVYFNIAIHNTSDNGSIQFQAAERWEISFK